MPGRSGETRQAVGRAGGSPAPTGAATGTPAAGRLLPSRSAALQPQRPPIIASAGDARPCRLPLRVGDAVLLTVVALRDRRLPELDGVEVGCRRVGVVLRAASRL